MADWANLILIDY